MYPNLYQKPELPRLALPPIKEHIAGAFWTPAGQFITELTDFLKDRSVLEVFAGNGLLAGYLENNGIHVTATSILSGMDEHEKGVYHNVEDLKSSAAVTKYGLTHDVLLMCWPTVTMDALHAAKAWGPGRDIIFIGEVTDYSKNHLGGCATDEFFAEVIFTHRFNHHVPRNALEQAVVCRLRE